MKIEMPTPKPRSEGDEYRIRVSKGYGDPHGTVILDENWELTLDDLHPDDCDRLIKAAVEIKARVLAYQAELAAPHGRKHLHKGTCQLCGKPEDGELHAEPKPLVISDSTIEAARVFAQDIEAGTWPPKPGGVLFEVGDDEAAPAGSGTPDWCPAFTVYDEDADHLTLYCDREAGHSGSHHAPGPDKGSEVAWSDEAAQVSA